MPTGLKIYNDSGIKQIDENFKNFVLVKAGSVTCSTSQSSGGVTKYYASISLTNAVNPLIALKCSDSYGICPYFASISGTTWTFIIFTRNSGVTVNYWIFDEIASVTETAGLTIFKADGSVAYHSSKYPLRIVGGLGAYTSGRSYAVIQNDPGFFNINTDNGIVPTREKIPGDPPWEEERYYQYHAYLRTSVVSDNVTSTNTFTWENYETQGYDFHQYPFDYNNTQFLTVDVTNFPTSL